ncbi:phytanoyl-CoA dioxygenase family protein [Granulosicoccaceae sp. 1_MG-2023]|nr:phytanoyl-CoA dioxygenase family protein [Granulosicoccaceae sp. 1_MG-2023]
MSAPALNPHEPASLKPNRVQYLLKRLSEPRCLLMSLAGRFWLIRQLALGLRSHWRRHSRSVAAPFEGQSRLQGSTDAKALLRALRRDGVAHGLSLSGEDLSGLLQFAATHCLYGDRLTRFRFMPGERSAAERLAGKPFQQAQYGIEELEADPHVQALADDPLVRHLVREYFGHDGVLAATRMFWSYPVSDEHHPYDPLLNSTHYHYDLDDYGCLRVFIYLTDVDVSAGAHRYIRGSHRRKPFLQKLIASHSLRREEELEKHYLRSDAVTVTAPAGSVFIEDASVFHEATRPLSKERLLMQLTFVSKDFALHAA